MVVDDDEGIRETISMQLKRSGYETFPVSRGEDAIFIAEGQDISLVVMDIKMPGLDGVATAKRLPSKPYVLFLTGYSIDDPIVSDARSLAMINPIRYDFLMKGSGEELLFRVARSLETYKIQNELNEILTEEINQKYIERLKRSTLPALREYGFKLSP